MNRYRADADKWKALQGVNSEYLTVFFENVDYLSRKKFGSRSKAVMALRGLGFSCQSLSVQRYKNMTYTDSSLSNLNKWCLLFDKKLTDMMSKDYSIED